MQSGHELAGIGQRFIALFIDGIILGIIGFVVGLLFPATVTQTDTSFSVTANNTGTLVSFIIGVAYYWFFLTRQNGQTIGKKVMGIRVVRVDGTPLTFIHVLIRYIGYFINSFVIFLGWIWAFFDSKKQGWHDKLAGTIVVKA